MSQLPLDVLAVAFAYLDMDDLLVSTQVCKNWRNHINANPLLWQHAHFHLQFKSFVKIEDDSWNPETLLRMRIKPNPTLVHSRLQGRTFSSLFYTLKNGAHISLNPTVTTYLQRFAQDRLAEPGRAGRHSPLHLHLEGFDIWTIREILESIGRLRPIMSLDIGTDGGFRTSTQMLLYFLEYPSFVLDNLFIGSVRIYPEQEGNRAFMTEGSHPANPASDTVGFWQTKQDGTAFGSLSVVLDQMWMEAGELADLAKASPSSLSIPAFLHTFQVKGGKWRLGFAHDAILEILVLEELWGWTGSWSDTYALPVLANLVQFHLSFEKEADRCNLSWQDLITVIKSTIGSNLEMLYLHIPDEVAGNQHRQYDNIWAQQIAKATKLRDMTLVNYFPSTLKHFTKSPQTTPPLRRLTFIGYQVYDDILDSCTPAGLPNLQIFDLSKTCIHPDVPAVQKEAWFDSWKMTTSVQFYRPETMAGEALAHDHFDTSGLSSPEGTITSLEGF